MNLGTIISPQLIKNFSTSYGLMVMSKFPIALELFSFLNLCKFSVKYRCINATSQ